MRRDQLRGKAQAIVGRKVCELVPNHVRQARPCQRCQVLHVIAESFEALVLGFVDDKRMFAAAVPWVSRKVATNQVTVGVRILERVA